MTQILSATNEQYNLRKPQSGSGATQRKPARAARANRQLQKPHSGSRQGQRGQTGSYAPLLPIRSTNSGVLFVGC